MGKYRYARSNGEFLPSRFVERAQSINPDFFTVDQAYDLTKNFASGSDVSVNSFISGEDISGYTGKRLVAWWRLNKDISASGDGVDSSGNSHSLSPPAAADRPSFDTGDTPSKYIQAGSCLFDGTQFLEAADSTSLSFGNGTVDSPFSIACRAKFSSAGNNEYIVTKWDYAGAEREYLLWKPDTDRITLELYDESRDGIAKAWTSDPVITAATWHHIVATYDGTSIGSGINIYIDGALASDPADTSTSSYTAMENTAANVAIANRDDESGSNAFSGNLADVGVWNRELTATEVLHLYGVSTAGAYRQVRNFDQVSPENDTRVLGVKSSGRGFNVSGFPTDMMDGFRQGVNVVTFKQLVDYTSFKIRPNSSFITTIRGQDVPRRSYDDSIALTSFVSGTLSGSAHVSIGGEGRLSKRLSHERELRDLGQTDVYVNLDGYEAYEDTLDLDPVGIINTDPVILTLPRQLVVQTSNEMMDGAIEPLVIRAKIDQSTTEDPFYAHDFRASLGGLTDAFRRSMILTYGRDLTEPSKGAPPFLDSVEQFGISGSSGPTAWTSGSIDLPGAFSNNFAVIEPYVDYLNDRDKEYTTNSVSTTISNMLIVSGSFVEDDMRTHDKMAPAGFIFDNNPIGIDSIAFGGLKK